VKPSDFELPIDYLRSRRNNKWHMHPDDVIPAFVAEMDFAVAPPIKAAVEKIVAQQDYGYPKRIGERAERDVCDAFARHMKRRFNWETPAEQAICVADLVQGTFASVLAFSDPGDGVILQVPNYPPFRESITSTERKLIPLKMHDTGERFAHDLAELKGLVDAKTKIFLLCSPQNPTGRVFSKHELEAIGRYAIDHDLIIVSDEIHADLVYAPLKHIPIASLSPEIAARTVTLTSATKSFNIPGLRCGVMHFGSPELMARFHKRMPQRLMGQLNITGIDATIAAWEEGRPWLDAVLAYLAASRDRVVDVLAKEIPAIRVIKPEATYLAWLNCERLDLKSTAYDFFLEHAKVGFSAGETFEPDHTQFVRLNFATSTKILDGMLERMVAAVRQNRR